MPHICLETQYVLNREGFIPEDVYLGSEQAHQQVKAIMTVTALKPGQTVPTLTPEPEICSTDKEGFIATDLCLGDAYAGATVTLVVELV